MIGVFSGQNLFPFAVGAGLTTFASAFDGHTEQALKGVCSVRTHRREDSGAAMVPMVGALFVAAASQPQGRFRSMTYDFAQALVANGAYTGLLKYTVKRERPDGSDSPRFLLGHTSTAFSLATIATHHYGLEARACRVRARELHRAHAHRAGSPPPERRDCRGHARARRRPHRVARLDSQAPAKKRLVSVAPATDPHGQGVGPSLRQLVAGRAPLPSGGSIRERGRAAPCTTCGCRSRIRTQVL